MHWEGGKKNHQKEKLRLRNILMHNKWFQKKKNQPLDWYGKKAPDTALPFQC